MCSCPIPKVTLMSEFSVHHNNEESTKVVPSRVKRSTRRNSLLFWSSSSARAGKEAQKKRKAALTVGREDGAKDKVLMIVACGTKMCSFLRRPIRRPLQEELRSAAGRCVGGSETERASSSLPWTAQRSL
mmetsp:Transcript_3207/g.8884  ORF Transcript_3207/g.8884 Transcript_3207/m.8884 type:complete len:130 (+) Transcript_3207:963-1352(+)